MLRRYRKHSFIVAMWGSEKYLYMLFFSFLRILYVEINTPRFLVI